MKKRRNELPGIEPFNYMWVGTCFHHGVCSAMPYLGVDVRQFVLANYGFYKERLGFESLTGDSVEALYERLGLSIVNDPLPDIAAVTDRIDAGTPVLAGVDCFYLNWRPDHYGKSHAHHFMLVFGYDRRKKKISVVENDTLNKCNYAKRGISFSEYTAANRSFAKFYGVDDCGGKVILKKAVSDPPRFEKLVTDGARLERSLAACLDNLRYIDGAVADGYDRFEKETPALMTYAAACQRNRNILVFNARLFPAGGFIERVEKLSRDYSVLLAMLGKSKYNCGSSFYEEKRDKFRSLLAAIGEEERAIHAALAEAGKTL